MHQSGMSHSCGRGGWVWVSDGWYQQFDNLIKHLDDQINHLKSKINNLKGDIHYFKVEINYLKGALKHLGDEIRHVFADTWDGSIQKRQQNGMNTDSSFGNILCVRSSNCEINYQSRICKYVRQVCVYTEAASAEWKEQRRADILKFVNDASLPHRMESHIDILWMSRLCSSWMKLMWICVSKDSFTSVQTQQIKRVQFVFQSSRWVFPLSAWRTLLPSICL